MCAYNQFWPCVSCYSTDPFLSATLSGAVTSNCCPFSKATVWEFCIPFISFLFHSERSPLLSAHRQLVFLWIRRAEMCQAAKVKVSVHKVKENLHGPILFFCKNPIESMLPNLIIWWFSPRLSHWHQNTSYIIFSNFFLPSVTKVEWTFKKKNYFKTI